MSLLLLFQIDLGSSGLVPPLIVYAGAAVWDLVDDGAATWTATYIGKATD